MRFRVFFYLAAFIIVLCSLVSCVSGEPAVMDSYSRPDVAFPSYGYFWKDNSKLGDNVNTGPLGGTLNVYIRNNGSQPLKIKDVLMDGISLTQAIATSEQRKFRKQAFAASIYFSNLPKDKIDALIAKGEPVWWRFEPQSLNQGECAELVIRLRHIPPSAVKLQINFENGESTEVSIQPDKTVPRMEGISFFPTRDRVYLYLKHPQAGLAPNKILMDGKDITADAVISADAVSSIVPVVCKLKAPLARASLHCFQAVYPNGDKITGAARVWDDELAYGMWGAQPGKDADNTTAKNYFNALALHNINTQMEQIGSEPVRAFMVSSEGAEYMKSLGIRRMVSNPGKDKSGNPWSVFLMDEPDAGDAKVKGIPASSQVGSLGQGLVDRVYGLRETNPQTPHLLNLDMTFKPQNWYTYGQLSDLLTADPYYQVRLAEAYSKRPERVPVFAKADFVYAVASVIESSQSPRPINLVLFTGNPSDEKRDFRFATPEEKRMEVYYALAAGAKGISYWWFHSLAQGLQPGKTDPMALAQWKEIGLLGAEVRTVGPLLMTGCPASVPVKAPDKLWTRSIIRGNDTLILLCVNDDYTNDKAGTHINPIDNAGVGVTLPKWLSAKDVFEVNYNGMQDVKWVKSKSGVDINLGKVNATRMIIFTSDVGLRNRLQKSYDEKFAANVKKLLAGS